MQLGWSKFKPADGRPLSRRRNAGVYADHMNRYKQERLYLSTGLIVRMIYAVRSGH